MLLLLGLKKTMKKYKYKLKKLINFLSHIISTFSLINLHVSLMLNLKSLAYVPQALVFLIPHKQSTSQERSTHTHS